jgi:2,3-bisphosphoglycerate-independent phosphoglycerate mutase
MSAARKPVVLIIRDGWGRNSDPALDSSNATKLAATPVDDWMRANYPVTAIAASGLDVGVPEGVMGNSEVGHHNIGAGRIVDQEIVRLNKLFTEKQLAVNPTWRRLVEHVRAKKARLHLMGIASDAGVHGLIEHLFGILRQAKEDGIAEVFIHAFTDGRDTPPNSGLGFISQIEDFCTRNGIGKIATVCGRFWSMDRDNRWDRVSKAYNLLVGRACEATAPNGVAAVQAYYDKPLDESRKGDEFVSPTWITGPDGKPVATIANGDAVLFYNYRGDRPREITQAFTQDDFKEFDRGPKLDLFYATMTEYKKGLPVEVILKKPEKMKNILGAYVAEHGIPQFRCAETEKYPHVTFFFNDYREEPFPLEDRENPKSPRVATYDQLPEMAAGAVARATEAAILSGKYGLVVVNFANGDMVGHTGSLSAAVRAVEAVDQGVGRLLKAVEAMGGYAVVTADHGNCEQMWDAGSNGPHTAHTLNPVEVFIVGPDAKKFKLRETGRLGDLAPTILQLMQLPKPAEMTGTSLIL